MRTALVLSLGAAGLAMPAGLGGCASLNRSISPGSDPLPVYAGAESTLTATGPSLTSGHDRSHWEPVTIPLPIHGTEHQPHYDWSVEVYDGNEAGVAAANIALGFAGIPLTAIQMFGQPPWSVERSPDRRYIRLETEPGEDLQRWHRIDDE